MLSTRVLRRFTPAAAAMRLCTVHRVANTFAQPLPSQSLVASSTVVMARRFGGGGADHGAQEPGKARAGTYMLDKNDVLQRVVEVVKNFEKVDASKVTPDSHFINDLGLDSLDVVEVVMALEQEFILDIPDHEAEKIQSIPEAVEYISQNPMAK